MRLLLVGVVVVSFAVAGARYYILTTDRRTPRTRRGRVLRVAMDIYLTLAALILGGAALYAVAVAALQAAQNI